MKTQRINAILIILVILSMAIFKWSNSIENKIEKLEEIEICTKMLDVKIKSTYSSLLIPNDKEIIHPMDNSISTFEFKISGTLIEVKSKSGFNYYVEGVNKSNNKIYWINSDLLTDKSFLNREELISKIKIKICDRKESEQ